MISPISSFLVTSPHSVGSPITIGLSVLQLSAATAPQTLS